MGGYEVLTLGTKLDALIFHCRTKNLKNENEERPANNITPLKIDIKKSLPKVRYI